MGDMATWRRCQWGYTGANHDSHVSAGPNRWSSYPRTVDTFETTEQEVTGSSARNPRAQHAHKQRGSPFSRKSQRSVLPSMAMVGRAAAPTAAVASLRFLRSLPRCAPCALLVMILCLRTLVHHRQEYVDVAAGGGHARVCLFGATVTSYRSATGREELFVSKHAVLDGVKAIRGGIPVVFPQFGADGPLPQHGFARNNRWGGCPTGTLVAVHSRAPRRMDARNCRGGVHPGGPGWDPWGGGVVCLGLGRVTCVCGGVFVSMRRRGLK
jgi:hypothetical protein